MTDFVGGVRDADSRGRGPLPHVMDRYDPQPAIDLTNQSVVDSGSCRAENPMKASPAPGVSIPVPGISVTPFPYHFRMRTRYGWRSVVRSDPD